MDDFGVWPVREDWIAYGAAALALTAAYKSGVRARESEQGKDLAAQSRINAEQRKRIAFLQFMLKNVGWK